MDSNFYLLKKEDLDKITEIVRGKLISVSQNAIPERQSSPERMEFQDGILLGEGSSEFKYPDGTVVRATWKLTFDEEVVRVCGEKRFSPEETVPGRRS